MYRERERQPLNPVVLQMRAEPRWLRWTAAAVHVASVLCLLVVGRRARCHSPGLLSAAPADLHVPCRRLQRFWPNA